MQRLPLHCSRNDVHNNKNIYVYSVFYGEQLKRQSDRCRYLSPFLQANNQQKESSGFQSNPQLTSVVTTSSGPYNFPDNFAISLPLPSGYVTKVDF